MAQDPIAAKHSLEAIPVARPDLSGNEEQYVLEAIRSSWISSTGPYVSRFELEFAALCGSSAAISVCNGTVALHLALLTLGVGPGDEVIVPSLSYIATANAVRYVGAIPVFVDVDVETWCLNPREVRPAITPRTKGIIAVHLYGHPADMDEINRVAEEMGLWVVEDAAEAPFATYKGRPVGSLSKMATFSFYGNKILTSGEGGAVTLSDPELERKARMLRGQGMDPARRYFFPITGYNFRLTNVACAILCAQLERRAQILGRRIEIYNRYTSLLRQVAGIKLQPVAPWASISPWLFSIVVEPEEFGFSRDEVMERLAVEGVETRPFFIPIHSLPPFADAPCSGSLPVTLELGAGGINLPTYTTMTNGEIERVCSAIIGLSRA